MCLMLILLYKMSRTLQEKTNGKFYKKYYDTFQFFDMFAVIRQMFFRLFTGTRNTVYKTEIIYKIRTNRGSE